MWQRLARALGVRPKPRPSSSPRPCYRPSLEGLEDRMVLSHSGAGAAATLGAAQIGQLIQQVGTLIPIEITNVAVRDGGLVALGRIAGQTFEAPLTVTAEPNQADPDCPILNLEIGEIHLDLLGLKVDTSEICLRITAEPGPGNLLGNLLCGVANLLNGGTPLSDILGTGANALTGAQAADLVNGVEGLLNDVFGRLTDVSSDSEAGISAVRGRGRTTDILTLSLGPVDLNVLGLDVELDNCDGGPVTLAISAERGPGNLLGNLISGLAGALDRPFANFDRIERLLGRIAGEIRDLIGLDRVGQVVPLRITDVAIRDGQLVGLGRLGGTSFEVPLNLTAEENPADPDCPILNLEVGEIHLDLLGLKVDTSEICLRITAEPGPGNLLGNLLCDVANLLNGGTSLSDVLGGLNASDGALLTNGLDDLLNGALVEATDARALSTSTTDILTLSLGPIDLNLLGLDVELDDCNNGPVTVAISAEAGPGNLLGNLLTRLAGLLDNGSPGRLINRVLGLIADLIGRII